MDHAPGDKESAFKVIDPQLSLHDTKILLGRESNQWMRGYMWVMIKGVDAERPEVVSDDFVRGYLSAMLFLEVQHQNKITTGENGSYAALAAEPPGMAARFEAICKDVRANGDRDRKRFRSRTITET